MENQSSSSKENFIKWIKRFGFWGFIFFLIKGLVWLALAYYVVK
ncbi:alanyl-tRNA synthetase [Chitinophaga rhizophila]|uniref:Alanyl-tRNA synthetase n=1 Tax=Chitinophaga rhizophila TaxID=2866212 RepID=A0ABS7GLT9_9BACT|nr:alanyl-tRNA synthetase [Chitinophaga rhizophila]MBW8688245.1 alanyl-tRNA synthetase [Chitinophaga rhizophila]